MEIINTKNIDCKDLLAKYIRYVMEAEGSDFIRFGMDKSTDVEFTKDEWNLLTEIANKVNN